jgi:hypothetical protein
MLRNALIAIALTVGSVAVSAQPSTDIRPCSSGRQGGSLLLKSAARERRSDLDRDTV